MSWFVVDDHFLDHPKVVDLRPDTALACIGLWTLVGTWCMRQLTDGFVPAGLLSRLGGNPEHVAELIRVKLWSSAHQKGSDGFQFVDWSSWQKSAKDILSKRESERIRKQGQRPSKTPSFPRPSGTPRGVPAGSGAESASPSPSPSPSPLPLTTFVGDPRAQESVGDSGTETESQQRGPLADAIARLLPAQEALPATASPPDDVPTQERPASGRTESYPQEAPVLELKHLVRQRFVHWYTQKRSYTPPQTKKQVEGYEAIASWLVDQPGGHPEKMLEHLLQRFFVDEYAEKAGFNIWLLANDPPRYFAPPKANGSARQERLRELSGQLEVLRAQLDKLGPNQAEDRAALIVRINKIKSEGTALKKEGEN